MEISKYMDAFIKELERKFFRPNSIDNYISCIGVFLKYFNENVKKWYLAVAHLHLPII